MFWRGVLGYLPVNIAQGVVGLLTIVVFTRLLTPAEYGVYALGFSVMALVHTGLFTWTEAAMARFQARAAEDGDVADHIATLYRIWAMIAVPLPLVAGLAVWLSPLSPPMKLAVGAGLAAILFRSLYKLVLERRRASGEVSSAAALDVTQTIGGFMIGCALAWKGAGGAGVLGAMGAVCAMTLPFVLPRELKLATGGRFQKARAGAYFAYGLPVALSLILALVISTTDRFLLAAFLDERTVGVYHAGYSLANRTLDVMFIWLGMAGGPAMVAALERGGPEALNGAAREQASFMVLLTLPASVGLALVAAPLSQVMIGEGLATEAAKVTPWIAFAAFFSGMTTYYLHQAFTLGRRTKLLFAAMTIPAGLNLILNLVLIPRFGISGAMWATAASYALGAAASFTLGRRAMPLPLPLDTLAKAGIASLLMTGAVLLVPAFGGIGELIAKAGAGAVVYGLVAFALDAGGVRSRGPAMLRGLRSRGATS